MDPTEKAILSQPLLAAAQPCQNQGCSTRPASPMKPCCLLRLQASVSTCGWLAAPTSGGSSVDTDADRKRIPSPLVASRPSTADLGISVQEEGEAEQELESTHSNRSRRCSESSIGSSASEVPASWSSRLALELTKARVRRVKLHEANATIDLVLNQSELCKDLPPIPEDAGTPGRIAVSEEDVRTPPGDDKHGGLKTWTAFFCICNALMGIAPTHPYGFSKVGVLSGFVLVAGAALLVGTSSNLGMKSTFCRRVEYKGERANVPMYARDASFVAFVAFGSWGSIIASLALTLELWSALVLNLVNAGIAGSVLTRGYLPREFVILIIQTVTVPMLSAPIWLFAFSSMLSLLALLVCVGNYLGLALYCQMHGTGYYDMVLPDNVGIPTLAGAFGIFFFSYGNAPCLQTVHTNMLRPNRFGIITFAAYVVSVLYYSMMGAAGGALGAAPLGQNYIMNLRHPVARLLSSASIVLRMPLSAPMMTRPILSGLKPILGIRLDEKRVHNIVFTVAFCYLTAGVAIYFKDSVAVATAFTGTSLSIITCVILPLANYWKLGLCTSIGDRVRVGAIFTFSLTFMAAGTIIEVRTKLG